jgi:hypothetical protein
MHYLIGAHDAFLHLEALHPFIEANRKQKLIDKINERERMPN